MSDFTAVVIHSESLTALYTSQFGWKPVLNFGSSYSLLFTDLMLSILPL